MAVSNTQTKVIYTGDANTTTYDFPFPVIKPTDIKVFIYDSANNKTSLSYGTDYTVSLNSDNTGSVTLANAVDNTHKILILREVPYTQETVYNENSPFPAKSHEKALDKLTMEVQQLNEKVKRALLYSPIDENSTTTLPAIVAGRFLGTDECRNFKWINIQDVIQDMLPPSYKTIDGGNASLNDFDNLIDGGNAYGY